MAGGGSIQGMITSLSNNKKMLRRKSMFRTERTFLSLKKEYIKSAKGEIKLKNATKEQLNIIRLKVLKERRNHRNSLFIATAIVLSIVGFLNYKYVNYSQEAEAMNKEITLNQQIEKFHTLIADGDVWLQKRDWHNAIFQYNNALEVFPNEYSVNYRLVFAFILRCEDEFKDCKKGKKLLEKLIRQFPEKSELLILKEKLEYEY